MRDVFRILMRRMFPPLFTIRIRGGRITDTGGKVTAAFLEDCSRITERSGISRGWIWGHSSGSGVRLEFSSGIGQADRQRFRNTAGVHNL
jgi:hypothetical protein